MVGLGTLTRDSRRRAGRGAVRMDPRRFLIVPLFAVALFALFATAGIRARRDPQWHKRFMLLATIALLPPAIARWVLLLGLGPPVVFAVAALLLVPLVVWDLRTLRRLHPVTLWAGSLLLISGPLRLALSRSDAWLAIADRLMDWSK